jgi:hypothetical protein
MRRQELRSAPPVRSAPLRSRTLSMTAVAGTPIVRTFTEVRSTET